MCILTPVGGIPKSERGSSMIKRFWIALLGLILLLLLPTPLFVNARLLPAPAATPTATILLPHRVYLPLVMKVFPPIIKSVVLFCTPKFIRDFDNPDAFIAAFFDHYAWLVDRPYREVILIFAVGNSEHILEYQGKAYWDSSVEWARYINNHFDRPFSEAMLTYTQLHTIVLKFKAEAARRGISFKIYDQIDQAYEFCRTDFKSNRHPECMRPEKPWANYAGYEIMKTLNADLFSYATAPLGIEQGKNCGDFLVEQTAVYVNDLEFDGILYGNQLGTRGHWSPDGGPGFSEEEAAAILHFFQYSKEKLGDKDLMWFDSYNNLQIEHDRYSMPAEAYQYFDYIIASGFCVVTDSGRYVDNLNSKMTLRPAVRVLATLDYVDPWYDYNSKDEFPEESQYLETVAIENFARIDGVVLFGNDELGNFIPQEFFVDFAEEFGAP